MYKGSYNPPAEETERLDVLQGMYKLAHYWDFVDSDLFNGLTRELIESIGTQTYHQQICANQICPDIPPSDQIRVRLTGEVSPGLAGGFQNPNTHIWVTDPIDSSGRPN